MRTIAMATVAAMTIGCHGGLNNNRCSDDSPQRTAGSRHAIGFDRVNISIPVPRIYSIPPTKDCEGSDQSGSTPCCPQQEYGPGDLIFPPAPSSAQVSRRKPSLAHRGKTLPQRDRANGHRPLARREGTLNTFKKDDLTLRQQLDELVAALGRARRPATTAEHTASAAPTPPVKQTSSTRLMSGSVPQTRGTRAPHASLPPRTERSHTEQSPATRQPTIPQWQPQTTPAGYSHSSGSLSGDAWGIHQPSPWPPAQPAPEIEMWPHRPASARP